MIKSLSIRNFKVLRDVDIDLQPLTVIVGPNASGKSSILQSIALLSSWLNEGLDNAIRSSLLSPYSLSRRSSTGPSTIGCEVTSNGDFGSYILNLTTRNIENTGPWLHWSHNLLSLDSKKLAAPSYPKSTSALLPSDGSGLSSVLAGLRLEYPDRFARIVDQLKTVIPHLSDIRVRLSNIEPGNIGHELLFDFHGADGIPAYAVSEGTLLLLGLLTALSTSTSPHVALIDDIERGLHPKALKVFIVQLRILLKQDPELQIIATSHSPYLLDYLQAGEVLLTSLDESGYAVVKPLTEHPEYERWKEIMDPGEFWSNVGEDWITKEKKATA